VSRLLADETIQKQAEHEQDLDLSAAANPNLNV